MTVPNAIHAPCLFAAILPTEIRARFVYPLDADDERRITRLLAELKLHEYEGIAKIDNGKTVIVYGRKAGSVAKKATGRVRRA